MNVKLILIGKSEIDLEIDEFDTITTISDKLNLGVGVRFLYSGREIQKEDKIVNLLKNENYTLYGVLQKTEVVETLVEPGMEPVVDAEPVLESEDLPQELPQAKESKESPQDEALRENILEAAMFSLSPIEPQIISIKYLYCNNSGMLYKI